MFDHEDENDNNIDCMIAGVTEDKTIKRIHYIYVDDYRPFNLFATNTNLVMVSRHIETKSVCFSKFC